LAEVGPGRKAGIGADGNYRHGPSRKGKPEGNGDGNPGVVEARSDWPPKKRFQKKTKQVFKQPEANSS